MQYKQYTVQTFERELGKWRASVRCTDGRLTPMKKIFVATVFAFVFATGMAIVTVIAQID
jgi:hypothetical protein